MINWSFLLLCYSAFALLLFLWPPLTSVTPKTGSVLKVEAGAAKLKVNEKDLLSEGVINKLLEAIYQAEGGKKAKVPYGILSVKVSGHDEAKRVCRNTIVNNYRRWQEAGKPGGYLEFLAKRFAPIGAGNDLKGFNQHWLKNVKKISGLDF